MDDERLTVTDILDAGLDDWRQLAQGLHGRFRTGDFVAGLAFVTAVTEAAEEAGHHPDVTLTYPWVDLALVSHDVGRVTTRDVDLARRISEIARERGIATDPGAVAQVEIALDTADEAAQGPFWEALLAGISSPQLWFQDTEAHETPRQRFHLDVWLPHDVADERIAAVVAAGGEVVDDSEAPSFTVLADPEGNRVCVCTVRGR